MSKHHCQGLERAHFNLGPFIKQNRNTVIGDVCLPNLALCVFWDEFSKSRLRLSILIADKILKSASPSSLCLSFGKSLQTHRLLQKILNSTSLKSQSVLIICQIVLKHHFLLIYRGTWYVLSAEVVQIGCQALLTCFLIWFLSKYCKGLYGWENTSSGSWNSFQATLQSWFFSKLGRINIFSPSNLRSGYIIELCVGAGDCIKIIIIGTIYRWNVRNDFFFFENPCHKWYSIGS